MKIPVIQGTIERRILVNYRVDPIALSKILPVPFRPKLINGVGMAGVCLIRLRHLRPRFVPRAFGVGSENAAHRIAVQWDQDGELREGVFIPRRDSSSRFNTMLGGRLFPGFHHHARFDVSEHHDEYRVAVESDDGQTNLTIAGRVANDLPADSVFDSVRAASNFFERGSLGYSTTKTAGSFDGLELESFNWSVQPLAVFEQQSNFFSDQTRFPTGSVQFDCALLMKNIEHQWHTRQSICGCGAN